MLTEQNAALRRANVALVQALDRIHDVLTGDEYMEHADKGIHEIVNDAIRLHDMTANSGINAPGEARSQRGTSDVE